MNCIYFLLFFIFPICFTSNDDFQIKDEAVQEPIDSTDSVNDIPINDHIRYTPPNPTKGVYYLETFQDDPFVHNRWYESSEKLYSNQLWKFGYGIMPPSIPGDKALIIGRDHEHYATSSLIKFPIDNRDDDLILQYELRFQKGIDCAGAYLKLLSANVTDLSYFNGDTPYVIMFGPDKCGPSEKIKLIIKHYNPISHKWIESNFKKVYKFPTDSYTHLYTLIIRKDNTLDILVDLRKYYSGSMLYDFEPPLTPPDLIDDPDDKKPSDWVTEVSIIDKLAKKPDDWDEKQPRFIEDLSATKPAGWLDDGPEYILQPGAKKPLEWNDEEDGVWEHPQIQNPVCKTIGCGPWTRPTIKNPKYKGKWSPPRIPNPAYKGDWKPKQIPNPYYYEDENPHVLPPIGSVGIEIWTVNNYITFDNIIIGNNEVMVRDFSKRTFGIKREVELAIQDENKTDARNEKLLRLYNSGTITGFVQYWMGKFEDSFALHPRRNVLIIAMISLFLVGGAIVITRMIDFDPDTDSAVHRVENEILKELEIERAKRRSANQAKPAETTGLRHRNQ